MTLSKNQFDLLAHMEKERRYMTQRALSEDLGKSVGTINKLLTQLSDMKYTDSGIINENGLKALEPYRVKRAVFIAAGFGSRLVPISLNTPKPLVRVNGVRMIDTMLDAVVAAQIEEIYIVRGYLSEQFDQLLYKYPMIKFIENPAYNESNNISSVMCARYYLRNAYVCEADLLLYNPDLITKYQYSSNYIGIPVEVTDDWCLNLSAGRVTSIQIGGTDCVHMMGISYWTEHDGAKLAEHVKQVYEMPGGKERYWDTVPIQYFNDQYSISVRSCTFDDIKEIDTYRELRELDKTYGEI